MRNLIFAIAIATPAFAYAQTPADIAHLVWNGAAAPAETQAALLPATGAGSAASLAALQAPLGARSVSVASAATNVSGMTGADLVRLSGRGKASPIVTVRQVAELNTKNAYR
jgi:hypothetical protein